MGILAQPEGVLSKYVDHSFNSGKCQRPRTFEIISKRREACWSCIYWLLNPALKFRLLYLLVTLSGGCCSRPSGCPRADVSAVSSLPAHRSVLQHAYSGHVAGRPSSATPAGGEDHCAVNVDDAESGASGAPRRRSRVGPLSYCPWSFPPSDPLSCL